MSAHPEILTLSLAGHLTRRALDDALAPVRRQLEAGPAQRAVLFDCLAMNDYDFDAREAFVAWHRDHRAQIERVAVVTERSIWHLVIRTMALASGMPMRPFESVAAARAWLEQPGR